MAEMQYYSPHLLNPRERRKVFNPRYIDLDCRFNTTDNRDRNFAYRSVDELSTNMRIYNFSNRICHVGHRDGGVSTLRSTSPSELMSRRCYYPHLKRDVSGRIKYETWSEQQATNPPDIKEGIYIVVQKKISIGSDDICRGLSTLQWHDPESRTTIIGDDYHILMKDGISQQESFTYRTRQPGGQLLDETGYKGPTYYKGETERVYDRRKHPDAIDHQAQREYEMVYAEYFVPIDALNYNENQYIYIEELDIVLSTSLNYREIIHPYSKVGKQWFKERELYQSVDISHKEKLNGINIINIDNRSQTSVNNNHAYYVNLGGSVITVKPISDASMKDGIYFYFHHQAKLNDEQQTVTTEREFIYMTHNEAISHNRPDVPLLYPTYQEALTYGDVVSKQQEEYRQRDLERQERLSKMKADLAEQQGLVAKLKAQLEEEKAKRDALYDEVQQKRKDHYESRSYSRKDESESLKFWYGAGGLLLGAVVMLFK